MKKLTLLLFTLPLLCCADYRPYKVESLCSRHQQPDLLANASAGYNSTLILSFKDFAFKSEANCSITIAPKSKTDYVLLVADFRSIVHNNGIRLTCFEYGKGSFDCSRTKQLMKIVASEIRLDLVGNNVVSVEEYGVPELTANTYQYKLYPTSEEFLCANGRHISKELYCDGIDNCGDMSDELFRVVKDGVSSCDKGEENNSVTFVTAWLALMVVALLGTTLLASFGLYYLRQRNLTMTSSLTKNLMEKGPKPTILPSKNKYPLTSTAKNNPSFPPVTIPKVPDVLDVNRLPNCDVQMENPIYSELSNRHTDGLKATGSIKLTTQNDGFEEISVS